MKLGELTINVAFLVKGTGKDDVVILPDDIAKRFSGVIFSMKNPNLVSMPREPEYAVPVIVKGEPGYVQFTSNGVYFTKGIYFIKGVFEETLCSMFAIRKVGNSEKYLVEYFGEFGLPYGKYYMQKVDGVVRLWSKTYGSTFKKALKHSYLSRFLNDNVEWLTITKDFIAGRKGDDLVFRQPVYYGTSVARNFFKRIPVRMLGKDPEYVPMYYFEKLKEGW